MVCEYDILIHWLELDVWFMLTYEYLFYTYIFFSTCIFSQRQLLTCILYYFVGLIIIFSKSLLTGVKTSRGVRTSRARRGGRRRANSHHFCKNADFDDERWCVTHDGSRKTHWGPLNFYWIFHEEFRKNLRWCSAEGVWDGMVWAPKNTLDINSSRLS